MVKADIVVSSNVVFTGLENRPKSATIAIKENKIIAVGSEKEIESFINDDTKEYNFNDQLIMAGFHDAHLHLMEGMFSEKLTVNLAHAHSEDEAVSIVKKYADENLNEDWIFGVGWDHTAWPNNGYPHRSSLDKVIADRPVLLMHAEGHFAWANTKALKLNNITRETEDPPSGKIQKDQDGELSGILIENAVTLIEAAFNLSKEKQFELLDSFLKLSSSLGVTSVNDLNANRNLENPENLVDLDVLKKYDDLGKLTTRIHLYPSMNGDIEWAKQLRESFSSSKLKVAGLKQFIDGVLSSHTAYMLDPYLDKVDTIGEVNFPIEVLQKMVIEADKENFQIRFHAIGDGAVRLGLNLFEEAQKVNGRKDSRHALEHIEVINPNDIPRFKKLGVVPSLQPTHVSVMPVSSHTTKINKEKYPYVYPTKCLLDAGAVLAFSTDFPVSPLNPMLGIYQAVTRLDFSGKKPWNEQEKLTLDEALKAYTSGSAYSTHRDHELGTIERGKLADIIVLDRNIFDVPAEQLLETTVELTIVDGQVVYEKESVVTEQESHMEKIKTT